MTTQPRLKQFFLTTIDSNCLHTFLLILTEFICRKMKGDTFFSGKKIVEESVVDSSGVGVGGVFQDGLT